VSDWPDPAELAQVLNVENIDDWAVTFDRVMAASIKHVKGKVGDWDEDVDEPDENLSQAALRMGELLALRPEAAADTINDPTFDRLIAGHRRVFGVG
jgi:hypothetical protein